MLLVLVVMLVMLDPQEILVPQDHKGLKGLRVV